MHGVRHWSVKFLITVLTVARVLTIGHTVRTKMLQTCKVI